MDKQEERRIRANERERVAQQLQEMNLPGAASIVRYWRPAEEVVLPDPEIVLTWAEERGLIGN